MRTAQIATVEGGLRAWLAGWPDAAPLLARAYLARHGLFHASRSPDGRELVLALLLDPSFLAAAARAGSNVALIEAWRFAGLERVEAAQALLPGYATLPESLDTRADARNLAAALALAPPDVQRALSLRIPPLR